MKTQKNRVFITYHGSASSLGITTDEILQSLSQNKPQPVTDEKTFNFSKPYYIIPSSLEKYKNQVRSSAIIFSLLDKCEDFIDSNENIPVFLSSSTGGIRETELNYTGLINKTSSYSVFENHFFNKTSTDIRNRYPDGKIGEIFTFSTACSSSGHAIYQAARLIKAGVINHAILLGIDIISKTTLIGFDSLQLVSDKASCPLTEQRSGLTLGEGAGILILENKPRTQNDFEIAGVGSGVDGYHITSPDPSGANQRKCITNALNEAGISAEQVGYVNAHGTGTKMNDQVELSVLEDMFGKNTCVTSLKSYIGHTLGASTVTEISICIDMLKSGFIYQPADFSNPISALIPSKTVKAENINYFLKNSFGFGGNNVSVLIKNNIRGISDEKDM